MTVFAYKARNRSGESFAGQLEADSREQAARKIRQRGLWVSGLSEVRDKSLQSAAHHRLFSVSGSIQPEEAAVFFRQMSVLLSAGFPVHEALAVLCHSGGPLRVRQMAEAVHASVLSGKTLHDSLGEFPKVFSRRVIRLVQVGEAGGTLDLILEEIADFLEESYRSREQLKSMMLYPMILMGATLAAMGFILWFVLPTLVSALTELHGELPWPTRFLLGGSALLQEHTGIVLALAAAVVLLGLVLGKQELFRLRLDRVLLHIPVYGRLILFSDWMIASGTLAVMLSHGVQLTAALDLLEDVFINRSLRQEIRLVRQAVSQGRSLSEALQHESCCPTLLRQLYLAGERSGELEKMMQKGAEACAVISGNESQRMKALAEPAAILMVGGLVLFFVLSIILPLLNTMDMLTG